MHNMKSTSQLPVYRSVMLVLALFITAGAGAQGKASVLWYIEQEAGTDPVKSRYIVTGDYLWTNMIVGEVFPTAITPSTWSVWQDFFGKLSMGDAPAIENIADRPYLNYSLTYSFLLKITRKHERVMSVIKDSIGVPPPGVDIPSFLNFRLTT